MSREQFLRQSGETDLTGEFYMRLLDQRTPRLMLELVVESEDERADFEQQVVRRAGGTAGRPAAGQGTGWRLAGRRTGSPGRGGVDRALPADVDRAPGQRGRHDRSPAWHQPVGAAAYRALSRWCQSNESYRALLGVAAFHAHAELQGIF